MIRDLVLFGDLSSRNNTKSDKRPVIEKITILVSEFVLVLSARASNWGWNHDIVGGLAEPPGRTSGDNIRVITNIATIEQISTIRHVNRAISRFNCFMKTALNILNSTSFP